MGLRKIVTCLATGCLTLGLVILVSVEPVAATNDELTIEDQPAPVAPPAPAGKKPVLKEPTVPMPATTPEQSQAATIFRDVPSISTRYSVGRTTLMPYVGAGFGSGYASQLDRSLNNPMFPNAETGLRSQFGQSFTPNEFQMGLRIPF